MKSYVNSNSDTIKNDPELQPSPELTAVTEELKSYYEKAQKNLKQWCESNNLQADSTRIDDDTASINGLDFYYFNQQPTSKKFTIEMNVSSMGSFDPNEDCRATRYYATVARFMLSKDLRDGLKTFVLDFLSGKKDLHEKYLRLADEHKQKIKNKVNEMNHQIEQENYEEQLKILNGIPADGYVFVLKNPPLYGGKSTGFTYRNKPVLISAKQEASRFNCAVPQRLVRVVGIDVW